MVIIGIDYHPSFQQIAFVDQETGECGERQPATPPATHAARNDSLPESGIALESPNICWKMAGCIYLTTYGGENAVPFGDLDLQRTLNESSNRGMPFVLRPKQAPPPLENH